MCDFLLRWCVAVGWFACGFIPVIAFSQPDPQSSDPVGLRVGPEFSVAIYADRSLAADINCMTVDSHGRIVVSGPGYIKTLADSDDDGQLDDVIEFASLRNTAAAALCFDGADLYAMVDGALVRYRDSDGNGAADGPPEALQGVAVSPSSAIRKGPDGWWHFTTSSGARPNLQPISPTSPIAKNHGPGALIRVSADFTRTEIVAHGFSSPSDLGFNWLGDLFVIDTRPEHEQLADHAQPAHLFHVAVGGHHGLTSGNGSHPKHDYYLDAVDALRTIRAESRNSAGNGANNPIVMAAYRHTQFPLRYRDGLFLADPNSGRIYFVGLSSNGSSYRTDGELFAEPSRPGAPNLSGIVVAPDGSLLISARGPANESAAIYRIQHATAAGSGARKVSETEPRRLIRRPEPPLEKTERELLDEVLRAPQPLEAWSRTRWIPLAQKLGPQPFKTAIVDERLSGARRLRAIEIVTEGFGGIETARAMVAGNSPLPQVRARIAWSLGRVPCEDLGLVLLPLAKDNHPLVRRTALEAITIHLDALDAASIAKLLPKSFKHRNKRLRQAAARLAARLPSPAWDTLYEQSRTFGPRARLTFALAAHWRTDAAAASPTTNAVAVADSVLSVLSGTLDPELQLESIRLLMLLHERWQIANSSDTSQHFGPATERIHAQHTAKLRQTLTALLPSGDAFVDHEADRLLEFLTPNPANPPETSTLPEAQAPATADDLRRQWSNVSLRDSILLQLSKHPDILDFEKFLLGLESENPEVIAACLNALLQLPRDPRPENMLPIFRLLERLLETPEYTTLRQQTVALINLQSGQRFHVQEQISTLRRSYAPLLEWIAGRVRDQRSGSRDTPSE